MIIYAGWSGAGGCLKGVLLFYSGTVEWWSARREIAKAPEEYTSEASRLSTYYEWKASGLFTLTHIVLSAAAGALFATNGQISGVYGAVAVGVAGPALLAQLGQAHGVQQAFEGKPIDTGQQLHVGASSISGAGAFGDSGHLRRPVRKDKIPTASATLRQPREP